MLSRTTLFILLLISLLTVSFFIVNHEENKKVWTIPDITNSPKINESFSPQAALILNDERSTTTSSTIPLDDNFQLAIKSYRAETEKRWAEAKKELNPHVTSSTKNLNSYNNTDVGVTFSFPSSLIITNDTENKTWGTLFVRLENEDIYPYTIGISVRDGERFNNEQEKYEHDITYYNWQSVYEHFRNTVLQAWEPLSDHEEIPTETPS